MEDAQKNLNQLSYEELKTVADQAIQQAKAAHDRLQAQNFSEVVARLNFNFKVLEFADKFPAEYVEAQTQDIMMLLPSGQGKDVEVEEAPKANRPTLKSKGK